MRRTRFCYCVLCAVLGAALAFVLFFSMPQTAHAQQAKPVSFIEDVAPVLKESCFGCHGAKNPKGKLNMTTFAAFAFGGTKGEAFIPGDPENSYLMLALTATDKTLMPPRDVGGPLPKDKIALIERWIKEGAKLDSQVAKDADLGRELRKRWTPPLPWDKYPFPVSINALVFSPDGKKLVASGHHELTVWDAATGKLEKRIRTRCRRALAMAFLPDGKLAVAGGRPGEEGDVRIYDLNGPTAKMENGIAILDGVKDPKVMLGHLIETDDEILCLAVSKDGKQLAAGGCDRMVHVFDLSKGYGNVKETQAFENHADWVFDVAFSPDGKFLLSASRDKTAKVWDLENKVSLLTFPGHQAAVYGVSISEDGKTAYSVGEDKQIRSWNATGDQVKQIRAAGGHGDVILKMVGGKEKTLATCSADKSVRLWNESNLGAVRTFGGLTDHVFAVALSPDGKQIAGGSWNGEVKIWNAADGKVVAEFNASPGLQTAAETK